MMPPERWINQTTFYDPERPKNGNCTEAAVASILGLPLEAVPLFRDAGPTSHDFWCAFEDFFEGLGFGVVRLPGNHVPDVLYLASGPAERGCSHMVVMRDGKLIHDPHPSAAGLLSVEHVWLVVPHDPARLAA
jgi:hypothetical protein